jgi:hypothetical protein
VQGMLDNIWRFAAVAALAILALGVLIGWLL